MPRPWTQSIILSSGFLLQQIHGLVICLAPELTKGLGVNCVEQNDSFINQETQKLKANTKSSACKAADSAFSAMTKVKKRLLKDKAKDQHH